MESVPTEKLIGSFSSLVDQILVTHIALLTEQAPAP